MAGHRVGELAAALLVLLMVVDTGIVLRSSNARELRPSDHGLAYQGIPPMGQDSSPETLTFFGSSSSSSPPPSSASAPHLPSVALPQAMNSSDAAVQQQQQEKPSLSVSSSSSSSPSSSSRSRSSDRMMKEGLLIGSLVCGIAGVALLAASAFIFLFHSAKKPSSSPSCPFSASAAHPQHRDHNYVVGCIQPAPAD